LLATTLSRLPIAFLAGLVSVLTPCVLPLVPGYLSAVSSVEANRLGERGVARRVVVSSLPFVAGFTVVFVILGAGAAAVGSVVDKRTQFEIAGFLLIVIGLGFIGLLPMPERTVAPGLLARARGSSVLLGAAFAICAAPCIGAVLASILVLAGSAGSITRGVILLFAYSLGLGAAFVLAGVAFARTMAAFRWFRDRYRVLQIFGGVTLVALGLLLFFERYWWLNVALNRVLEKLGLQSI
jgi:cytochrome c-type biogenesis protein